MGYYKTALICKNGHDISKNIDNYIEKIDKFCSKCGEANISACPNCQSKIRGDYEIGIGIANYSKYKVPLYCYNCGDPYPWTKTALKVAKDLAAETEGLTDEEKTQLSDSIDDLVKDGPRTILATTRFKRLVSKAAPELLYGLKDILIDIISETAKKAIWPN